MCSVRTSGWSACCANACARWESRGAIPTSAWPSSRSGSSRPQANARTPAVAPALAAGTRWAGAVTAFATGPRPSLDEATEQLRAMGARRLVIAPWFLAHGRITDRVAEYAGAHGISMAEPLGAHRLVAETVLDRFDRARAASKPARGLTTEVGASDSSSCRLWQLRVCPRSAAPGWPARTPCRLPSAPAPRRRLG